MKKLLALVATALLATACSDAPLDQAFSPIRFTQPPFRVNVAQVQVEDLTPVRQNAVDNQLPVSLNSAIQQWSQDRVMATGSTGTLFISIEDASVLETPLPKTDGIKGFFTDDQDAKYDAKIIARLRVMDGASPMPVAEASVNVQRGRTINEKATLQDREKFYYQLVTDLMSDFNREADSGIRQYLGQYISY